MSGMRRTYHAVKAFLKHRHAIDALYQEQFTQNAGKRIQRWNWWREDAHSGWFEDFILKRGLQEGSGKRIAFCSVFGEREVLDRVDADVRVFFSGENLHHPHRARYADYMLSGKRPFDLGLGFDVFENDRYLRFPLWLIYMFEPDSTREDIIQRCEQLCHPDVAGKDQFCALIARSDRNGIRKTMYDSISGLGRVDCPSALLHNDDRLVERYQDDKTAYLRQYLFNICPENSTSFGYTTEKVFESISAGCIPVYWGNDCLDIVNPSIVLLWNRGGDNQALMDTIANLRADQALYNRFTSQDWLLPNAANFVIGKFEELEGKLKRLLH